MVFCFVVSFLFFGLVAMYVGVVLEMDALYLWLYGNDGAAMAVVVLGALFLAFFCPLPFLLCVLLLVLCLVVAARHMTLASDSTILLDDF